VTTDTTITTASEPVGINADLINIQVQRQYVTGGGHYGVGTITVQLGTTDTTNGYFATYANGVYTPLSSPPQIQISNGNYYGAHDFYYIDTVAESSTITATSPGYTSATASIATYAQTLSGFNVTSTNGGKIGTQTTGAAFNVMITAVDQFGNAYTGYTGENTLTASSGTISPTPTTAFTAGVWSGAVTIAGTFTTPVTVSISTTDSSATTITGTSNTFALYTPALNHFTITASGGFGGGGTIGNQQAGVAFGVKITAIDQEGNTMTSFDSAVTLTETGVTGGTVSPSPVTFAGGVYTGNVYVTMIGSSVSITATSGSVSSSSNTFAVTPGNVASFTITGYPTSETAGTNFGSNNVIVTAYDAYGNIATNYRGSVYFTSTDAQATLPYTSNFQSYTFTAADNGAHTFAGTGFTLKTAGSQTITVTTGTVSKTSNTITVSAGALYQFSFSAIGTDHFGTYTVTSGTAYALTITAQDQYGNTVTTYSGTPTISSSGLTGGTITTNPTSLTFASGVWTGTITITITGTHNNCYLYITGYQNHLNSNTFTA
jgi:hypothetical protein